VLARWAYEFIAVAERKRQKIEARLQKNIRAKQPRVTATSPADTGNRDGVFPPLVGVPKTIDSYIDLDCGLPIGKHR
jgi:hypothetical protein